MPARGFLGCYFAAFITGNGGGLFGAETVVYGGVAGAEAAGCTFGCRRKVLEAEATRGRLGCQV